MTVDLLKRVGLGLGGVGHSPEDLMLVAKRAEDAGFLFVRVGDSVPDAFVMSAALACATSRIEVRTGVALWGRTPVQTAFAASTMDELSKGRFRLGLGPGPKERSVGWHDISYDRVVARFRDYVSAVKVALASRPGNPASYAGPFYRFSNFALFRAPLSERIPVDLAANGPQMLKLAGEIGDMVLLNAAQGDRYPRDVAAPALRAGEAKAGRPAGIVPISGGLRLVIAKSRDEALELARPALIDQVASEYNRSLLDHYGLSAARANIEAAQAKGDRAAILKAITDDVVDMFVICGDGDYCRKVVASYGDVLGEVSLSSPVAGSAGRRADLNFDTLIEVFGR